MLPKNTSSLSRLPGKQNGFSLIDTMFALALLAAVTVGYVQFKATNQQKKDAKVLSAQTSHYAVIFARYLNNNEESIAALAAAKPVILSPQTIQSSWPPDLAKTNLFQQTPCLAVVTNPNTSNIEAIMYYVGGNSGTTQKHLQIVRDGSIFLGGMGGILLNGAIAGNSGWQIASDSQFLQGAAQCGANLSNNSLAVNLNLLSDFNQNLQPAHSLLRGVDQNPGLLSLPGHVKNANTSKANIYFANGKGIVLDNSNPANPDKLSVLYGGQGTGAATVGLGNSATATLAGDTFQPNILFKAGEQCNPEEAGKTVADEGLNNAATPYLARSTLVCTQNSMLCGNGSYCYLASVANNIVFQNNTIGIQDINGNFSCPSEVPYATNYALSTPGGQAYVFYNIGSNNVPNTINVRHGYTNGGSSGWLPWTYAGWDLYFMTDFNNAKDRDQLLGIDLSTIIGPPVGTTSIAYGSVTPITEYMGEYSVVTGYSVLSASPNCSSICAMLSSIAGNNWQTLGTQRMARTGHPLTIQNQNLGCACERTDFDGANDNYTGIAAVIGSFNSMLTSVTCSNSPIYTSTKTSN